MRGTEKSEGNFTMWMGDGDDGEDLGNWIVKQEWSNGQVLTFGASADGIASYQMPRNNPQWLTAQYIAWAPASMYEILFPGGTYKQETTENWLFGLNMPNPDVVYDNLNTVYQNEAYSDFWKSIEVTDERMKNVRARNSFWAGWYDLFLTGNLVAWDQYNTKSDESVRYTSSLTVDPLGHCLDGADFFTEDVIEGRTALVLGQIFETYGIKASGRRNIKNVTFYVMSSNDDAGIAAGQYWTTRETFPTPTMTDFYLHSDGTVSVKPPTPSETESTSYVYDPSNPVLTMGGNNLPPAIGGSIHCGPMDQSVVDARPDVLLFETGALQTELALTGPIFATLYVSSDAVDTDFMVKLSDVYPTGEANLIQDSAVRMRWRNGGQTPEYMNKRDVYEVEISLWNTSFVVAPGHKLRVAVTSSNWPRFSVNPNNGLLLADPKYPGNNITATNTLHHSLTHASKITLPVVSKKLDLPKVRVIEAIQETYPEITRDMIRSFGKKLNSMMGEWKSDKPKKF